MGSRRRLGMAEEKLQPAELTLHSSASLSGAVDARFRGGRWLPPLNEVAGRDRAVLSPMASGIQLGKSPQTAVTQATKS